MGRRRAPIMSFKEAFDLTKGITGSVLSAGEVDKLGPDAEAVKGVGLKITAPDGSQSTGVVDPAAGGDFDAITKAYTDQGYKVEKVEAPQYAARSGSKDTGIYTDENAAKMGARETNQGLKIKRADVYEKYGLEDKAKGLRAESRQDRLDMQNTQRHEQQTKLGNLQIESEQSNADKRKRSEGFFIEANQIKPQSPDQWRDLAVKHNLPLNEQWEVIKNVSGIETQMYEQVQAAQLRAFDTEMKASGGKLESFMERTYNDEKNPLWADGKKASIVRNKNGVTVLSAEGNVVAQGTNDTEVFAQLRAGLKDPGTAMALQHDIARFHMSQRESESKMGLQGAQTAAANANASESNAKAGLARRTDPNAGKGGSGNEKLTALTGYANSLNTEIADINKAMMDAPPGSPQYKALSAQRDRAVTSRKNVRAQIEGARLGLSGGEDVGGGPATGTVEDGHRFKGGNPGNPANWEPISSPARAPGVNTSTPKQAPSRPMTEIDTINANRENKIRASDNAVQALSQRITESAKQGDTATAAKLTQAMNKLIAESTKLRNGY